jgi:metal-dependent HD superfamily phosphatase/phosphodiesterase
MMFARRKVTHTMARPACQAVKVSSKTSEAANAESAPAVMTMGAFHTAGNIVHRQQLLNDAARLVKAVISRIQRPPFQRLAATVVNMGCTVHVL